MQLGEPSSAVERFYYLANFQAMIETLQRRDGDLLAPEEPTQRSTEEFRHYASDISNLTCFPDL